MLAPTDCHETSSSSSLNSEEEDEIPKEIGDKPLKPTGPQATQAKVYAAADYLSKERKFNPAKQEFRVCLSLFHVYNNIPPSLCSYLNCLLNCFK